MMSRQLTNPRSNFGLRGFLKLQCSQVMGPDRLTIPFSSVSIQQKCLRFENCNIYTCYEQAFVRPYTAKPNKHTLLLQKPKPAACNFLLSCGVWFEPRQSRVFFLVAITGSCVRPESRVSPAIELKRGLDLNRNQSDSEWTIAADHRDGHCHGVGRLPFKFESKFTDDQ